MTQIRYSLPEGAEVRLTVYTMLGENVAILVKGRREAGRQEVDFDASTLPSGIYIYKLEAGRFTQVKKMVLIR